MEHRPIVEYNKAVSAKGSRQHFVNGCWNSNKCSAQISCNCVDGTAFVGVGGTMTFVPIQSVRALFLL